jgi:hypothetical protein
MKINHLTPQGSKLTEQEVKQWHENTQKYSADFNGFKEKVCFDLVLLENLQKQGGVDKYMTPMWKEHVDQIEELLRQGDIAILDNDLVRYAIYLTCASEWANKQIPYLRRTCPPDLLKLYLKESAALHQTIIDPVYKTSESRVNHLTHLTCFEDITKQKISEMSTIVEFGGGYGGMTCLLKKYNEDVTIVVIDIPVMIALQSFYVSKTLGEASFNVLTADDLAVQRGRINYVSISLINKLMDIGADLFIATWSLSEANQYTQDIMESLDFFGAKHILYGYRFYGDKRNPRQPKSAPLPKMLEYDVKFHGPTFWCLNNEQYYLFA